ncbi:uncharacterized protein LOC119336158 isoform X1 [Triticum dicoccoides]|uniref:uncharacterized protein LOC119336158 isoform X1 n=1 Tax=Triticum dicoccoides TaxID=85692 RepID=UPI0018913857|nr:uncharacterized protein LOC119336158 isoform X1 [Triticum dicoccoides]
MAAESGEAQILAAAEAAAGRRESSPRKSELSMGKRNPLAPGWNKRLRIGAAAPSMTPCPNRISAFEKAVRCFAEKPASNVLGTTFDSLGKACDFYNLYSWKKGFGIRYGKRRLNVEWVKCMQEIVCGCSGKAAVDFYRQKTMEDQQGPGG